MEPSSDLTERRSNIVERGQWGCGESEKLRRKVKYGGEAGGREEIYNKKGTIKSFQGTSV